MQSPEILLSKLNDYLKKSKTHISFTQEEPKWPTVFIISAPMSGSTLASQILDATGQFGKISNFIARFWEAPYMGAMIEKIFDFQSQEKESCFDSNHGQTKNLTGPHEFGNFWNRWFDLGINTHKLTQAELTKIDGISLKNEIAYLEEVFQKPVLFKNNTWCSFQADWLSHSIPKALFVVCERPILYVAQWLMLTRRNVYKNDEIWWSMKPSNYEEIRHKNKWEQVLLQAYHCKSETNDAIAHISKERVLKVDYKKMCQNPENFITEVIEKCNMLGANLSTPKVDFPKFMPTDTKILNDPDWQELCSMAKKLGFFDE